ncbi:ADP-ribosylation factor family protein [Ancylostoma ceylanicum]|uniref:ADP-ribosylation factor family protein n=1 Tax=Ancylostoma ceylanicum TaxID=53326 RepID=A0A0D6MD43_9BILA|nr:ADP-ribosylation factor family protein [Ancylostoma ceylanicum]
MTSSRSHHLDPARCDQPVTTMGFLSSLSQMLGVGRRQVNVIVVGLDNSGKTTMLNYLRTPETRTTQIAPTVGYSVTNFVTENFSFTAFDMAGQVGQYFVNWAIIAASAKADPEQKLALRTMRYGRRLRKYRNLWETYYVNSQAVIFVVDSADRLRMAVARDELWMILDHKDINGRQIPILVLANKMDAKDAMTSAEISTSLGLDLIRGHKWNIHATCALNGAGIQRALEWLSKEIKTYMDSLK